MDTHSVLLMPNPPFVDMSCSCGKFAARMPADVGKEAVREAAERHWRDVKAAVEKEQDR